MYVINVGRVIADLGGHDAVLKKLTERGPDYQVSPHTIDKWETRGIVPMKRWLQLCELAASPRALSLHKYVIEAPTAPAVAK